MNMSISPLNRTQSVNRKYVMRKEYLDFLRIISSFAVVFVHVFSNLLRMATNDRFTNQLLILGGSIRWCVPVFFMISGALMIDENKQYSWNEIINKVVKRVIKPYLVWSIIYQILYCFNSGSLTNVFTAPAKIIIGYGWYHLWYLYALIGLYICIPFLSFVWRQQKGKMIAVIGSLIMVIVNTFNLFLPEYYCTMFIPIFSGYTVYFVLGAFINSISNKKILFCCSIIGIASIIAMSVLTMLLPDHREQLWDYNNILICLEAIGVVALAKLLFYYSKGNSSSIFSKIGKYTFGIYLCHDLFLQLITHIFIPDSMTTAILYGVIAIVLSCILVFVIMKNRVLRKMLL